MAIYCHMKSGKGGGRLDCIHWRHPSRHHDALTAWSVAGILGPVLVNYLRQYQIDSGIPKAQAYNTTMYIMAGLLLVGLIANALIKPVDERHYLRD